MKKIQKKTQAFGVAALVVFLVAMVFAVVGMSSTVQDIETAVVSNDPEVILASAGISEERGVFLSASYVDKKADECVNMYTMTEKDALDERQFEWSTCGYDKKEIEKGIVKYGLGDDNLPVAKGGRLLPNRAVKDMEDWFNPEDGTKYVGALKLDYRREGAVFTFSRDEFYPLDELGNENENLKKETGDLALVDEDLHNHLFTMSFAIPFTVLRSGSESFEITADDDTFVFVGDKLAIDMGGIHDATTGRFVINEDGEVYAGVENEELGFSGITLGEDEGGIIRIFHADRDSSSSVFKVRTAGMNLTIVDAKLANRDEGVLQVAYDPTDPTYVPPLGESAVIEPDNTRKFIIIATIEGVMVMVLSLLIMMAVRNVVHRKMADQEEQK